MLFFTVRLPFPLLCFWVVVLEIFVEQTHNGFIVNPGVWWAHRVAGAWRSRVRLQLGSIDSCALRSLLHRNNLFLFMLHVHVLLFYRTQIKTFFWLDPIFKKFVVQKIHQKIICEIKLLSEIKCQNLLFIQVALTDLVLFCL